MWKPPERIKFETAVARWPSAEEAAGSRLYSPLTTPNFELTQRTWVPAMVPWRASEDGDVTQDVIDWYARFAEGRPGAIVIEATGIRDIPSGPLLRISSDRYLPGLQRLTNAVREASGGQTRLFIQLIDFLQIRRRPQPGAFFERFLEVTALHRERLGMEADDEQAVRQRLATLEDAELEVVLAPSELEALRHGELAWRQRSIASLGRGHIHCHNRRHPLMLARSIAPRGASARLGQCAAGYRRYHARRRAYVAHQHAPRARARE